ncbi:MAG: phosphoglucosamine mutase, partial [Planctomycetales bacterium]|nr:phosphoglucosamine mutase [Planctomycetales bacterium]
EGNGGVIDPRVGWVRDSFVGMALVLDAMAARDLPVSQLADELPQYAIHKTTIAVPQDQIAAALAALETAFPDAAVDRLDGLRLDWPDGAWLLVRPSNTEPIVRAIAEAPTRDRAVELCEQAAARIQR